MYKIKPANIFDIMSFGGFGRDVMMSMTIMDEEERIERPTKLVIEFIHRRICITLECLDGRQADAPQEALQVSNIMLREMPTNRYSPIGHSFYHPAMGRRQPLGEGLENMPSMAFVEQLPCTNTIIDVNGEFTMNFEYRLRGGCFGLYDEALYEIGKFLSDTVLSEQSSSVLVKALEDIPVMFIAEAEDAHVPLKYVQTMALKFVDSVSKSDKLFCCGHLPHEECPKVLLAAIVPFISKLSSKADK
ncbi:alpha/beta hydrolases superfamily protein [Tanacetum coccineum]